jgi:NADH-quinone oxidoreductase subunit C
MSEENNKPSNDNTSESSSPPAPAVEQAIVDAEKEAKVKAAAEAREARANARAKAAEAEAEPAEPKAPSPKQPMLDRALQIIREQIARDAVVEAYINENDRHLPTITITSGYWLQVAQLLKDHEEFQLNYLRNVSGVDLETHQEVVYHLLSLTHTQDYCIHVRTNRDEPSIPSVTPIWSTANWNEREIYDLLGVQFPGHPDMRRIMMPDDWVGHPLRKDYEALDPEV